MSAPRRVVAFALGLVLGTPGCGLCGLGRWASLHGSLEDLGGIVVARQDDTVVVAFERDGEPRTVTYEVVAVE